MKNARRSGLVARICRAANWSASSQEIRRNPRSHRVQREEIESNGAQMDALHREVAEARGPERTSITDAVPEDPPREDRPSFVVPGGPEDFAIVVGLREAQSKGNCADAPDPSPSRLRDHVCGILRRLIFLPSEARALGAPSHLATWTPRSCSLEESRGGLVGRRP